MKVGMGWEEEGKNEKDQEVLLLDKKKEGIYKQVIKPRSSMFDIGEDYFLDIF